MASLWHTDSLPELRERVWATLAAAAQEGAHPWRMPALATISEAGPQVRTVILREVGAAERQLVAQTDARAPKVRQLSADDRAEWLFHDGVQRVQMRATTRISLHRDDDLARAVWAKVPAANRPNYRGAFPPGSVIATPDHGRGSTDETVPAHFAVLVATVSELDWLWLADAGHRRARFRWHEGAWDGAWLTP